MKTPYRDNRKCGILDAATPAKPTAKLSHVFSLQRPIDSYSREASFVSYQAVLPQEGAKLAAAGLRSNSVRSSITDKEKTQGGGQQTPRINLGGMNAAWATQATSVALTMGIADFTCRVTHSVDVRDPSASCALHPTRFFTDDAPTPFILSSTARLLPHALPTRIHSHSFLDTMRTIARNELEMGQIRQRVPQQVDSLRSICNAIVDNSDGMNVWASWVLLVYMLTDPRLRRMIQATPITDLEAATAFVFQSYGRAEITRRARMEAARHAKQTAAKKAKTENVDPAEDDDEEDDFFEADNVVASPSVASTAASVMQPHQNSQLGVFDILNQRKESNKTMLSAKRKRQIACPVAQPQPTSGYLDYWDAALNSEYASILKTLITQSKTVATAASMETLCGQAPQDHAPSNKLLVRIASENAMRSAEAISGLVITLPSRVPQIVTWRCRNARNRVDCHVGLVRSTTDSTNTTLHACKAC